MKLGLEICSKVLILVFLAISIEAIEARVGDSTQYNVIKTRIKIPKEELQSPWSQLLDAISNSPYFYRRDNFRRLPEGFEAYISEVSREISETHAVQISPNLIKSIIKQESGFNPYAISHAGAEGLMQLMPGTAKLVGVQDSLDPYQNLRGGVTYFAQMLQRFDGNLEKALAAYNAGPETIEKYRGIPPYQETQNYVLSILRDYKHREDFEST